MRDLHKVREQEGLLLAPTQVYALLGLIAVALCLTFILGFYVGRKAPPPTSPPEDPLVPADVQSDSVALLLARAAEEEAEANDKQGPDLQFHDILPARTGEEGEAPPPSGVAPAPKPVKAEDDSSGASSTNVPDVHAAEDKDGAEGEGPSTSDKVTGHPAGTEKDSAKDSGKTARGDKSEKGEKVELPEKTGRGEKSEKVSPAPEKTARSDKGDKESAKSEKSAKSERNDKESVKSEKSAKSEKSEKDAAKAEKNAKTDKDARDARSARDAHDKAEADKKAAQKDKADKDSAARDSRTAKKEPAEKESALAHNDKTADRKTADTREKERTVEVKKPVKEDSAAQAEKSAGKGFTVQVSSYQEASIADKLVRQLGAQGFSAYKVAAEVNGHTWYRVRIGAFESKESAEKEMQRLKAARSELNPMIAHR